MNIQDFTLIILVGTILITFVVYLLSRRLMFKVLSRLIVRSSQEWDEALRQRRFYGILAYLGPLLTLGILVPLLFIGETRLIDTLQDTLLILLILDLAFAGSAALSAFDDIYEKRDAAVAVALRSLVQVGKIVLFSIAGLLILTVPFGVSTGTLLAILGALAAVISIVFRDLILGFVASIILASNHLVEIGDWIQMDQYGVDGHVQEITLATVKVQNWDQTFITVPTYSMIGETFTNWRGMQESGGRRISRAIFLDMNSIRPLAEDLLAELPEELASHIDARLLDEARQAINDSIDPPTNLSFFRAYVEAYLRNHPKSRPDMLLMVRLREPTPQGLPIDLYFFVTEQEFYEYEAVQSEIFDFVISLVPIFELEVFQAPAGRDILELSTAEDPEAARPSREQS